MGVGEINWPRQEGAAEAQLLARRNARRSRYVWLVIAASAVMFLAVCGVATWGVGGLLSSTTDPKTANIEAISGSKLAVQRHNTTSQELITGTAKLREGDIVSTGGADQAFISLFDDSGTIQVFFNSQLQMDQLRTTRFFQNSRQIAVVLHAGTIVMKAGDLGDNGSASYSVATDQAQIDVTPGSRLRVRVEEAASGNTTQVVVDAGSATLRSHGKKVELGPEQMATADNTEVPVGPMAAQEDLIHNGTFDDQPTSERETAENGGLGTAAWLPLRDETGASQSGASVSITSEVNLNAAVISGAAAGVKYVRVGMFQDINRPTAFFNTIELSATVKLVSQVLPAGGPIADVYPLTIRVVYTDSNNKTHEWKRSFYFQGPTQDLTDQSALKISQGRWTTTQEIEEIWKKQIASGKGNLPSGQRAEASIKRGGVFVLKSPTQIQDISVINTVEVYGYGTQFQSWITDISLMAR